MTERIKLTVWVVNSGGTRGTTNYVGAQMPITPGKVAILGVFQPTEMH